ncbi:MAG TPA: hypothetical protein DCE41_27805 [Cytophagales bacterium]|nr:hypothetical protein [Cytophagales bacterium]
MVIYGALTFSVFLFIKTLSAHYFVRPNFLGAASHPQLHAQVFPVDSLVPLSSLASSTPVSSKMKVVSFVSDRCPFCTKYLKTVAELDEDIQGDFDFLPVYMGNNNLSSEYLTEIGLLDKALYSGQGISIAEEIQLVPTILFLNENNEIVHTSQGAPDNKVVLEAMLVQVQALGDPS